MDNKAIVKKGLEELGPMSFREKALMCVSVVIALFGWIFSNSLHINATIVAIIAGLCFVLY